MNNKYYMHTVLTVCAVVVAAAILYFFGGFLGDKSGVVYLFTVFPLIYLASGLLSKTEMPYYIMEFSISVLMFIPVVFIVYNDSALIYVCIYAVINLIGKFIGTKILSKN